MHLFHWIVYEGRFWVVDTAQAHPLWVFPIAFVVAFSESFVGISFIVPGTFLLMTLGGVIGASQIGLLPAWTGAVLGSILGDWISWWIGIHYHRQILHMWPFCRYESHIEKALHFFNRWGIAAIFIGRFLGPFRATVPLVAGISEVSFWPFQIANAASAFLWAYALLAFPAVAAHLFIT